MPVNSIELSFSETPIFSDTAVVLTVIPCTTDSDAKESSVFQTPALQALAEKLTAGGGRNLDELLKDEAFTGKHGQTLYLPDSPAGRVLLAGVGSTGVAVHRLESTLTKSLARINLKELDLVAAVLPTLDCGLASTALAVSGAFYQHCYRSKESRSAGPVLHRLTLHAGATDQSTPEDMNRILSEVQAMCAGRALTMDLVNTPSNIKRTATLVEQAQQLGENQGLSIEIVDDVAWIEEHMPCFFSVARGSVESDPPKWIRVSYRPEGEVKRKIAVVGKAVIFDTGGYQVKPGDFMNTMKADMAGSAAVFGAMQAIGELKPQGLEVQAFFAATPNMIDSRAMLPDSIVDTTCGKKVEIRHTDAEGRLTLIDAVALAEREEPEAIVTVATLTGAASRAVGMGMALMSRPEHTGWRSAMEAAAHATGDRVQVLDVMEEDFDNIKSKLDSADIRNTNRGKSRGAQTAAAFVMHGAAASMPLVHLDIAGGDMSDDEKATGIAAKCIVQFLLHHLPA
ncbi:MAG: leucyl aminopeptidase family protein [bacterium]|nr:leucyl aminopeptidase family protein [bacterium]